MQLHCMKCGSFLHPSQQDGFQREVCTVCGWIYYNNPRPCVTAIIHKDEQLLFVRRAQDPGKGLWDFPGGFMEIGEHPEAALKREVSEELGSVASQLAFFGFYTDSYSAEEHVSILNMAYLCRTETGFTLNREEIDQAAWFPLTRIPGELAFSSMRDMIDDAARFLTGGWKKAHGSGFHAETEGPG